VFVDVRERIYKNMHIRRIRQRRPGSHTDVF
ncbi:MAG: hypothetical protein ACI944_001693, partial [Natronomonas sp.]